jgi:Legume-like lectin family
MTPSAALPQCRHRGGRCGGLPDGRERLARTTIVPEAATPPPPQRSLPRPLPLPHLLRLLPALLALLALHAPRPAAASWGSSSSHASGDTTPGGPPRHTTAHVREELKTFPYMGRGDGTYSFHHPFRPSVDTPIDGWMQLGTAIITAAPHDGRDMVRLTNAAAGNQGVLYAQHHTTTNDLNGYFDVLLTTSPGSLEPADGMGLFFTQTPPMVGSAMGIDHTFRGLGLVIDTFSNSHSRAVPYLYAFVSNGDKPWNPDTDGADTELTKGCHLEMNRPTRIFFQLLDNNLHVAISMNQHNHDRWHTCFKYNNVPMPFEHGGHLAFAAETGHYFAFHDVYAAAFIVGDIHNDPEERQRLHDEFIRNHHQQQEQQHHVPADLQHHNEHDHHQQHHNHPHGDDGTHKIAGHDVAAETPAANQAHHGAGATTDNHAVLSSTMDAKVHQLYAEFGDLIRAHTGSGTNDQLLLKSLEDMSRMTSHLLHEIDLHTRQIHESIHGVVAVKQMAADLRKISNQFTADVAKMHQAVELLRQSSDQLRSDNEETHHSVISHSEKTHLIMEQLHNKSPPRYLSMSVFFLSQAFLVAGFAAVYRMGATARKLGPIA